MRAGTAAYRLGTRVWAICACALVLVFSLGGSAVAAPSVDASPVVTVPGSVTSVDGTVVVSSPVVLATDTVEAIGALLQAAEASAAPPADLADAVPEGRMFFLVASFWLACAAGYTIGR